MGWSVRRPTDARPPRHAGRVKKPPGGDLSSDIGDSCCNRPRSSEQGRCGDEQKAHCGGSDIKSLRQSIYFRKNPMISKRITAPMTAFTMAARMPPTRTSPINGSSQPAIVVGAVLGTCNHPELRE